ncbi:spermatogenesis-associated protein 7 isoform X2 [Rhinatrema bivittatum]|uniref:spermatogenesis-associated protein 7 isoform X2 n=1 Tax=Rhinatrema bivittatum TaxID=194408 RepID=UPI00112633C9|nr:spermatogenesis-associated protein 7 isoform X2 [Rhinatrema bivittatum]
MRLPEDAMDGRRSRVNRSPSIPKYGLASPFKGHFSTKSNAFCTGSSSRLSDQFRIQDHMTAHYNKILSAKAAIDSSMPKSMLTSIKYSDQQRREKLKKEVARYERDCLSARCLSRPSSGASQVSSEHRKSSCTVQDGIEAENGQMYGTRSLLSSPIQDLIPPESTKKVNAKSISGTYHKPPTPRKHFYAVSLSSSEGSLKSNASFQKFQDPQKKTYNGDLLDLHSDQFTKKQQRFTPRTLKTEAKSVLVQYRYYTPARRKKKDEVSEAETQTEISSFRKHVVAPEKKDVLEESHWAVDEDEHAEEALTAKDMDERIVSFQASENSPGWDELGDRQYSLSRVSSSNNLKSPSPVVRKIKIEEEELLYLEFIAQITNEILALGLFSSRVLARVFERHIEDNKHRLDEGKMRHLLDILRMDLGYKAEESSGKLTDGSSNEMATLQQEISKTTGELRRGNLRREYKDSKEFLRTGELSLQDQGESQVLQANTTLQQISENSHHLMEDPRDVLSGRMDFYLVHQKKAPEVLHSLEKYHHLEEFLEAVPKRTPADETESSAVYPKTPDDSVALKKSDSFEEFLQKGPGEENSNEREPSAAQEEAPGVLRPLQKYHHLEEFLKDAPSREQASFPRMLQEGSPDRMHTSNTVKHESATEEADECKELHDLDGSFSEIFQDSKDGAYDSAAEDLVENLAETGSEESGIY